MSRTIIESAKAIVKVLEDNFYILNGRWIAETSVECYLNYEKLFNTTQADGSAGTTTVNGYQQGHSTVETKELADEIILNTNAMLANANVLCKINNHIQTWSIQYNPGGWKGLHCHNHSNTGATAVVYFDEPSQGNNDEGALYAVLADEYGNNYTNLWHSAPGKLIVMDSRIWHGVYPTIDKRRVLVLDFEATYHG